MMATSPGPYTAAQMQTNPVYPIPPGAFPGYTYQQPSMPSQHGAITATTASGAYPSPATTEKTAATDKGQGGATEEATTAAGSRSVSVGNGKEQKQAP